MGVSRMVCAQTEELVARQYISFASMGAGVVGDVRLGLNSIIPLEMLRLRRTHTKVSIAPEGFNEERTSQVEESEGVYEYDETYHTKAFVVGSGVVYKTKR